MLKNQKMIFQNTMKRRVNKLSSFFLYFHKNAIREKNKPFYRKRKNFFFFLQTFYIFFLEVKEKWQAKVKGDLSVTFKQD